MVGRRSVSDECPQMWGAAISAIAWVSRGHIKEIRLAANHTGKAPQSSTQIDETRRPLSHNLCAINLPCTCCVFRTNARPYCIINCASQCLLLSIVKMDMASFPLGVNCTAQYSSHLDQCRREVKAADYRVYHHRTQAPQVFSHAVSLT